LDAIAPLDDLIKKYQPKVSKSDQHFLKEFILWGLVESKKLSKSQVDNSTTFRDKLSDFVRGGFN
jgi:magnesium chelatase subunit I